MYISELYLSALSNIVIQLYSLRSVVFYFINIIYYLQVHLFILFLINQGSSTKIDWGPVINPPHQPRSGQLNRST